MAINCKQDKVSHTQVIFAINNQLQPALNIVTASTFKTCVIVAKACQLTK